MRRTTLGIIIGLAAGLALAPAAAACTLVASPPKDRVRAADLAIYGVVSSVRMLDEPPAAEVVTVGRRFEARIRVSRVFRGGTARVIRIDATTDEASCGIGTLRAGQRLGLLLNRPGRPYAAGLGSRIALSELLRATRGKWHRPV